MVFMVDVFFKSLRLDANKFPSPISPIPLTPHPTCRSQLNFPCSLLHSTSLKQTHHFQDQYSQLISSNLLPPPPAPSLHLPFFVHRPINQSKPNQKITSTTNKTESAYQTQSDATNTETEEVIVVGE